jgi:ribosomal protein L37AE/L43A
MNFATWKCPDCGQLNRVQLGSAGTIEKCRRCGRDAANVEESPQLDAEDEAFLDRIWDRIDGEGKS